MDVKQLLDPANSYVTNGPGKTALMPENLQAFGLLSTTIIPSPSIKFIIPINNRNSRDEKSFRIFLVFQTHVELKTVGSNGHLRHVTASPQFPAKIRAAGHLGTAFASIKDVIEIDFDSLKNDHSEIPGTEHAPSPHLESILVLALHSQQLVFVRVLDEANDITRLSIWTRPLPYGHRTIIEDVGKFLAIAPNSMAMAIGGAVNSILLYSLHAISDCEQKMAIDISSELAVNCDCTILSLQFLQTEPMDKDVHLLLIGSKQGKLHLCSYRWNPSQKFESIIVKKCEESLDRMQTLPVLTACLKEAGSFLIVQGPTLSIYSSGISGKIECRYQASLQLYDQQIVNLETSLNRPSWTALVSPLYHIKSIKHIDDIFYLFREDGFFCCLEIAKLATGGFVVSSEAICGTIGNDIDTGVAIIDFGSQESIYVVAGGVASSGGVYEVGLGHISTCKPDLQQILRHPDVRLLRKICVLENWSPFVDIIHAQSQSNSWIGNPDGSQITRSNSLFGAFTKGNSGALSELRHGYKADIEANFENPDFAGVRKIWYLFKEDCRLDGRLDEAYDSYDQQETMIFVIALPEYNILMSYIGNEPQVYDIGDDNILEISKVGRFADWTRCAGSDEDFVLKVTSRSTSLLRLNGEIPYLHSDINRSWPCEEATMASVDIGSGFILSANCHCAGTNIQLKQLIRPDIEFELQNIGSPVSLDVQTTCIKLFPVARSAKRKNEITQGNSNLILAMLGCESGTIFIFRANPSDGLSFAWRYRLIASTTDSLGSACESIAAFFKFIDGTEDIEISLLCGLRNGELHIISLSLHHISSSVKIHHTAIIRIGSTPIQVFNDMCCSSSAFLYCDTSIFCVEFGDDMLEGPEISRVWIIDVNDTSYSQSPIFALIQSPSHQQSRADLFAISGMSLLILKLDRVHGMIISQTHVDGVPHRLLYSEYLGCFALSALSIKKQDGTDQRIVRASIVLLRQDKNEQDFRTLAKYDGPRLAERFTSMIEFFCESHDERYHQLVVSSEIRHIDGHKSGSIRYFNMSGNRFQLVKEKLYQEPIYAMGQFGKTGMVLSCGFALILQTFSFSEKRFVTRDKYMLNSPGIHITCEIPYVSVSTASDSLLILILENDNFKFLGSDNKPRAGLHHIHLSDQNLIMFSDKFGSVAALSLLQDESSDSASHLIFEAHLACSAIRLRKANVRPLWKQNLVPGVLERNIYGATADGSLINFNILNEASWRLLKFIQTMCERNKKLCYAAGDGSRRTAHLEPDGRKAIDRHIDGNVLIGLTGESNPAGVLNDMLDAIPNRLPDQENRDFDSSEMRRARFSELLFRALNHNQDHNARSSQSKSSLSDVNLAVEAMRYLKRVLEKAI